MECSRNVNKTFKNIPKYIPKHSNKYFKEYFNIVKKNIIKVSE